MNLHNMSNDPVREYAITLKLGIENLPKGIETITYRKDQIISIIDCLIEALDKYNELVRTSADLVRQLQEYRDHDPRLDQGPIDHPYRW